MALKFDHLHLKAKDPEQTAKFYIDIMGAKLVNMSPTSGYRLDLHGLTIKVSPFANKQKYKQKYGMEHIAVDTDEMDSLLKKLKRTGTRIFDLTADPDGRRYCFFEGPDGALLEFVEMKPGK